MLVRRMLLLVAVLMAVTAVVVALAPQPRSTTDRARTTPAKTGGAAAPPLQDDTAPDERLATLDSHRTDQVISVPAGRQVHLRVVTHGLETVQLGTDGPIEAADADSPAEFDVLVDAGTNAPVRLLESGRTIGRLTAQP